MKRTALDGLFTPRSIALVGASSQQHKIGYLLAANILEKPFGGDVHFVNPRGGTILGRQALQSIAELPRGVDLMILSIPKQAMLPSVREAVQKGVRCIVALTAGFRETGDQGQAQEAELRELLRGSGTRLVGPNCAGVVDTASALNATIEVYPERGRIALVSQSGSLCSAFASSIRTRQAGVSKYVSLGNKLDVNEADLVEYLGDDEHTGCIALYLEDISDGRRLRRIASEVSLVKPIVVLKAGCTDEGARATFSHTGAMAGTDRLIDGALRQMGALRVEDLTELYDLCAALSILGPLPGGEIAVLSDAGGPGVIATDAAVQAGLRLPELAEQTKRRLSSFLSSYSSVRNPVDMTVTDDVGLYGRCIEELVRDRLSAVLVTIPSHFAVREDLVAVLAEARRRHGLPIVVAWLSADEVEEQRRALWRQGVPCFSDPRRAAAVMGRLHQYGRWLARRREA